MRTEFGYCSVCDKEIAKLCTGCGAKTKTADYTEVEVQWSNGSKMNIAVCLDCAAKNRHASPEAKATITKAHQDYWDKKGGIYDKAVALV